jgi:hypothetical protein
MITVSLTIIIVSSPLLIREFIWTKYLLITITGTGLFYIIYGLIRKLFGLIIAGSLLASIGPGISLSWGGANTINGLSNTGAMLVWFALGWFFIVIFYKLRYGGFIWWPLIPGCVLAITGWGLYIGGSPDRAVGVIGNSGSIGLILIGIYLLLIKNGMNN